LKDLKAINDFISLDSKFYAARFINRLIQRVDQLVLFPDSGRIVPEKNNPEIRELIEGNYRIFTDSIKISLLFLEYIMPQRESDRKFN
jgi:plasmid stabilization system protein ParE